MATLTATGARCIHLSSAMLVPGVSAEVPDEDLKLPMVKALIETGELAIGRAHAAPDDKAKRG